MDKRDLHDLVLRLRLVGAYDTNISERDVETCLEAARVIEDLFRQVEKAHLLAKAVKTLEHNFDDLEKALRDD